MAKVAITWLDKGKLYSIEVEMPENLAQSYRNRSDNQLFEHLKKTEAELKMMKASSERKKYDTELKNKPADRTKWPK